MDITLARPPRPWALQDRDQLRVGQNILPLADVQAFETGEVVEPNVIGHLMAVGLFLFGGALFIIPVAAQIARPKFLLGGVLLIFIGLTAIGEILRARSIHLFHVDIRMKSGRVVRFTSDQKAEAEALAGLLRTRTR